MRRRQDVMQRKGEEKEDLWIIKGKRDGFGVLNKKGRKVGGGW